MTRIAETMGIIGTVLAGGASSRMGRDKAGLELGGETLAAAAARRLAAVCPEVVIADRGRQLVPGLPSLPDGPGRGPAAGLLGVARAHPGRPLLALACDLPHVPVPLLAEFARIFETGGADWVVPRWRRGLEPLCALWGPRALSSLEERTARGIYTLWSLAEDEELAVHWLEGDRLAAFGSPEEMFFNVNTPEELETARVRHRPTKFTPEPS